MCVGVHTCCQGVKKNVGLCGWAISKHVHRGIGEAKRKSLVGGYYYFPYYSVCHNVVLLVCLLLTETLPSNRCRRFLRDSYQ